jgi:Sap, sulfolipid-1-addressing protein
VSVLALLMVWPLLIPVVVFLVQGGCRESAMKSMKTWLTRNQRMINVVVLGVFGILLLAKDRSAFLDTYVMKERPRVDI